MTDLFKKISQARVSAVLDRKPRLRHGEAAAQASGLRLLSASELLAVAGGSASALPTSPGVCLPRVGGW